MINPRFELLLAALGALATAAPFPALAAPDYGVKGSEPTTTTDLPAGTLGTTGSKLVVPGGAGPYPVLVTSHGFSASSANQLGWAEHFASWGFVVAVPSFPNSFMPDTDKNASIIEGLVGHVRSQIPKADVSRVGLEGHSAGGLATTVAAAKMKPQAVVLFDPVDRDDRGKAAYATLCSPVLALFAQPGACNNQAGWKAFAGTTPGPLVAVNVVGATHCDGENAARGLCPLGCQSAAADAGRQRVHARYATALFLARLKGDAVAAGTLTAVALSADPQLASPLVQGGVECAPVTPPPDAGVVPSDAGVVNDSGSTAPPVSVPEGGPVDAAAAGAVDVGPSGCSAAPARGEAGALAALALALTAVLRRRRG